MRSLVALVFALWISTAAAWAVVEAQLAGDWKSDDGTVLQIQSEGQYKKLTAGRIVETGTLTALDGKWNLRSDSGRLDSGTFSIIGGALTLRSSVAGTTTWKRGASTGSSTIASSSANKYSSNAPATNFGNQSKPLQSGVSVSSQQPPVGITGGTSSYPAPVAVQPQTSPRRGVKGGLKSFASILQQAAESGYANAGSPAYGNFNRNNATSSGGNRYNFSRPQQSGGAPDPFLARGGSFRDAGDGHGTYSAMRKKFDQDQLASLPAAKPITNNPNADETAIYGVGAFEARALGPATPYRIKFLGM
jgi:hypothetical protein